MLSMVITLSMSHASQPNCGALLLCMVVIDSIHRACESNVRQLTYAAGVQCQKLKRSDIGLTGSIG
jgi:hypothetical protein